MKVDVAAARELSTRLLIGVGLRQDRAAAVARALVLAEVWGLASHGLLRLPVYLDRIVAGGHPSDAELRVVTDTGALLVLDGGGGLGHWQLGEAVARGVDLAREHGVALVAVGDSGHCGALGIYSADAAAEGMASLVFSTGPAVLPPWGGDRRLLSTSPLAAGFPGTSGPMVVDLAMSAVARGKIAAYAARGEQLPDGWALDAAGEPTTDPAVALTGMLSPLGGAKGFALAFMVEAMTAGLVGPSSAQQVADLFDPGAIGRRQGIAHLAIVIDPERTDGAGNPAGAAERLAELARATQEAGGRVPGARRLAAADVTDDLVIDILDPVWDALANRSSSTEAST